MDNKKIEQTLRDLILLLRNTPQAHTFSDIRSKIDRDFKDEIDRILKELD